MKSAPLEFDRVPLTGACPIMLDASGTININWGRAGLFGANDLSLGQPDHHMSYCTWTNEKNVLG